MNLNSKKYKLPKRFWEKGKSKFLFCRLAEDKNLVNPYISNTKNIFSGVITKVSFWQRLINWLKIIINK